MRSPAGPACSRPELHRALARYEFGATEGDERRAIEAHLLECDVCFIELERGSRVAAILRDHAVEFGAILTRPATRREIKFSRAWLSTRRAMVAMAACALLVAAGLWDHERRDPARLATFPREVLAADILRSPAASGDVQELMATGAAHFELEQYDEAAQRFVAAFARDPQFAEAAYLAGLSRALAGDARGAIPMLESALRLAPGTLARRAGWVLANAYLKSGATDSSRAVLAMLTAEPGAFADEARALLAKLDGRRVRRGAVLGRAMRPASAYAASDLDPGATAWHAALTEARQLYDAEQLEACREQAGRAAELAAASRDDSLEFEARWLLGECHFELGFFQPAGAEYAKAQEIAQRLGDRLRVARALEGSARVSSARGQTRKALDGFRVVADRAAALGDFELQCRALIGTGQCQNAFGERPQAAATLETALGLARMHRLAMAEVLAQQELSLVLYHRGDHQAAILLQEEALARARLLGRRRFVVGSMVRAGLLYAGTEQYSRALAVLREALPLAQALGHRRAVLNIHGRVAAIRSDLNQLDEAVHDYQAALALARDMQQPRAEAGLLRRLGGTLAALQRFDEASRIYDEAMRVTDKIGSPRDRADLLHLRGEMHLARNDPAAAAAALARAIAAVDSLSSPRDLVHWRTLLAEAQWRNGEREPARAAVAQIVDQTRRRGYRDALRDALRLRASIARQEGALEVADRCLAEAIDVAESVRAGLAGSGHRVGFQERSALLNVARVGVLFEIGARHDARPGVHEEAFRVAEETKVRTLLDVLAGIHVDPGPEAEPRWRAQEREALHDLRAIQSELARIEAEGERDLARIDSLDARLAQASRRLRELREEVAVRSPSYGQLFGFAAPLDVSDVRAHVLTPDQTLLEYLVGPDDSYIFLIDRERFQVARLQIGEATLQARVREFRQAILADSTTFEPLARELYRSLLEPVAAGLDAGARLVIVPDGPLFQLPFAALHDGTAFLAERYSIAHAPSASVLDDRLVSKRKRRRPELLAAGNPSTHREALLLSELRGARGWRFGELPYAGEEVRRIGRHFRRKHVLVGADASEENVKAGMRTSTYLHFATHGLLDSTEPLLSGLVLAQDDDAAEDGFLQTHEILNLGIPADLVVLSGCSTGLGRTVRGEGVLGLTRAFLHAGARRIVISLWDVADRSTVSLMDDFYAGLFESHAPADHALRTSQRSLLAAGSPPREWAAFLLVGRVEP